MIPEASFLFSIAGVSGGLAGLAGLVAGLRRGGDFGAMDVYRLREIVEFAFANVLLALSTIPVVLIVGDLATGVRIEAVVALAYTIIHVAVLIRRSRLLGLTTSRPWAVVAVASDLAVLACVIATLAWGTIGPYEVLLLVLVARPMSAFLLVLGSFQPGR